MKLRSRIRESRRWFDLYYVRDDVMLKEICVQQENCLASRIVELPPW